MKMPPVPQRPFTSAAALAALSLAATTYLHASSIWDGGTSSPATLPTWDTAANWSDDQAPTFGNTADLSFPTSAVVNFNTVLGGARTVRSLSFGADVDSAFTISFQTTGGGSTGANLTFDTDAVGGDATITVESGATGNITLGSALGGTLLNPILADNLVVNHNGSGLLLFNRPFQAAAFGITKNGTGTVQTNNNNLLTGALNINGGKFIANTSSTGGQDLASFTAINLNGATLQISANGNTKTYANGPVTVTAPSTLEYRNPSVSTTYNATFSGAAVAFALNADLTFKNISDTKSLNNVFTISRPLTGTGHITVEGYDTLTGPTIDPALGRFTLSGNNTAWSGDLYIRRGTAGFGGDVRLSSLGSGKVYLGETGNTAGAGLQLVSFNFTATPMTVAKDITVRSGGFRTIRLSSDNTYNLNGAITLENDLTLCNAGFFNTYNLIVNGNITGTGSLNITESGGNVGAGFTRLTGNNTYVGATTIGANATVGGTGATLSVLSTSGNAIPDGSAVSLIAADTLFNVQSSETIGSLASTGAFGSVNISSGSVLTTGATDASTVYSGTLSGAGSLVKTGTGTFALSGSSTHSGDTTVSGGVLVIGHTNALGIGGAQSTTTGMTLVESGTTLDLNGTSSVAEPIVLSGTGVGGAGALVNTSSTPASIGNGVAGLTLGALSTGSNYSVAPAVTITGTGTGATATATLGVTAASFGAPTVTGEVTSATAVISGGGGTGATATVSNTGEITITNPGTGFTSAPVITVTAVGGGSITYAASNATSFTVSGVSVTAAGSGYTEAPTYSFDAGDATPGTATLSSVVLAADSRIGGTGDITISAKLTESGGARALTKVGTNTLTLSAPAYSGDTLVAAGKLALGAPNTANETSTVSIATVAVLELAFAGTDTVDKLFLDGVQQPAGTYTSAHASGAFQGGGSLVVTSSPASGDATAPVITLIGNSSVNVAWGGTYADAGATATDNVDGSVTVVTTITPGGSVNTAKPGTYTITYNATDAATNAATPVTRTVTVAITDPLVAGTDGFSPLLKYALGATSPGGTVQAPATSSTATTLSLTAVVRTDDSNLSVTAETTTDLSASGSWTTAGVTETLAADQTNLPAGCVRKVFTVSTVGAAKKFLRLKATNASS